MKDAELAAHLAEAGGALALRLQAEATSAAEACARDGDRAINRFLVDALRQHRPDDGLLSEEEGDDPTRLSHRRVWIIDPIDGSREYGERRADWAVHVGLAVEGKARVGAVALPALGLVLRSDQPLPPTPARVPPRMVVSRSRAAPAVLAVARVLGAEVLPMGSAGAKAMAVVRGEADIYLHTGGQHEWDSCAPVAVAAGHGLHVSRADGSALRYNGAETFLPDLLICKPELADSAIKALAEIESD